MKKLFFGLLVIVVVCFGCVINVSALEPTRVPDITDVPSTPEPSFTPEPPLAWEPLGDINEDGFVNAVDALMVLKHAAKIEDLSGLNGYLFRGDIDNNSSLDAQDALYILQYAANIIDSLHDIRDGINISATEVPEDYYIISEGQTKDVKISTAEEKVTFEFTPTESGYYRYHSSGDIYVEFGSIKDSEGNLLIERTDYSYYEFGVPVFWDEFSFDFYFEAGKKYYLEAFLDRHDTGSFKVSLMLLSEAEKVVINGKEPINCPYGTEKELSVSYSPVYSIGFIEKWESSDTEIVTVDENGKIKGVGIGTASVTVTTTTGLTYTTEIEVTDHNEIKVGDVKNHMALFEAVDYYKFVPDIDGEYIIKSCRPRMWNTVADVNVKVYDSSFQTKLYSAGGVECELKCDFKAGESYYLVIESYAGDNGFSQFIEIVDIDEVLELSVGDTITLTDIEASSGTPCSWKYEIAEDESGVSINLVAHNPDELIDGEGVIFDYKLNALEQGEYIVYFTLCNNASTLDYDILERITYKVIVK